MTGIEVVRAEYVRGAISLERFEVWVAELLRAGLADVPVHVHRPDEGMALSGELR